MTKFASVEKFLQQFLPEQPFELKECLGGKNNKSYQVISHSKCFFLKCFLLTSPNTVEKLKAEYYFLQLLEKHGVNSCAKPIAVDFSKGYLLLSYLNGTPFNKQLAITGSHITLFRDFIVAINQPKILTDSQNIGFASDRTASVADAIEIVSSRITRLTGHLDSCQESSLVMNQCSSFVRQTIIRTFEHVVQALPAKIMDIELEANYLSPSDFGLHNVMVNEPQSENCTLDFVDFEYAGKDSLHKLLADFFCQPRFVIDVKYFLLFIDHPLFVSVKAQAQIFLAILRLTQLKWSLILLNEFVPDIAKRRSFSIGQKDNACHEQLSKSQNYLSQSKARFLAIAEMLDQGDFAGNLLGMHNES